MIRVGLGTTLVYWAGAGHYSPRTSRGLTIWSKRDPPERGSVGADVPGITLTYAADCWTLIYMPTLAGKAREGKQTMRIAEAVAKRREQIEEAERQIAQERAVLSQKFAAAMQERLELQYGLEFAPEELAAWTVDVRTESTGEARFQWVMPVFNGHDGYVGTTKYLSLAEVEPPGIDFDWRGFNGHIDGEIITTDLIAALTFAMTGKRPIGTQPGPESVKSRDISFERRLMTLDQGKLYEFLDGTIGMFLEYVNVHGHGEGSARSAAIKEMLQGTEAMIDLAEHGEL
ncbi:MAG: hypothetical protein IT328_23955 [Caldilineaceae bacterium]|nr:hypothetical protein [Caldilineaceae bacterium]